MSSSNEPDTSGEVYADYVKELLDAEDKHQASIEARGHQVITASGTLVTLLFALAAVVTGATNFQISEAARDRLVWALVAFVLAAVLGIATYAPQRRRTVDLTGLKVELRSRWMQPSDSARKKTTADRLQQLLDTQRSNNVKGWFLVTAVLFQVTAVVMVAWGVASILSARP